MKTRKLGSAGQPLTSFGSCCLGVKMLNPEDSSIFVWLRNPIIVIFAYSHFEMKLWHLRNDEGELSHTQLDKWGSHCCNAHHWLLIVGQCLNSYKAKTMLCYLSKLAKIIFILVDQPDADFSFKMQFFVSDLKLDSDSVCTPQRIFSTPERLRCLLWKASNLNTSFWRWWLTFWKCRCLRHQSSSLLPLNPNSLTTRSDSIWDITGAAALKSCITLLHTKFLVSTATASQC